MGYHIEILIGQKFGILTVIGKAPNRVNSYLCQCECGKSVVIRACDLQNRKSCGCLFTKRSRGDFTGVRHGMLEVISFHSKVKGVRYWNIRCDCGTIIVRPSSTMAESYTGVSCGCRRKAILQAAKAWKPDYRSAKGKALKALKEEEALRERAEKELGQTGAVACGGSDRLLDDNSLCGERELD